MVKGLYDELRRPKPRRHTTVGIIDDVSHSSIDPDPEFTAPSRAVQAVFYGLGADGTVGANKQSVGIIGERAGRYAQGYFVYDSNKSGSVTTSHLRFGSDPIRSTYLIEQADFVACHQFGLLEKTKVLGLAKPGAIFLLNSAYGADQVWEHLPVEVQQQIIDKKLGFYVIDAYRVAREVGLGTRINTVMQPCFFALSNVLPREEGIAAIKDSIEHAYGKRGRTVVERNFAAVDRAVSEMVRVDVPAATTGGRHLLPLIGYDAPDFVTRVTQRLRHLRRHVPGAQQGGGPAQVHQHGAGDLPPRRRAAPLRLLPRPARGGSQPGPPRHGQGVAAARALVRVLRRLLRLWRDAVPEAAHPALR